jgi:hypothetical protein
MSQKQAKYARKMLRRNKWKILDQFLNEIAEYSFRTRFVVAWDILWTRKEKGKTK